MDAWKTDVKRLPRLLVGLMLLAIGIYLTKLSGFGMAPWAVFHVGLAEVTGIPFGFVTQLVGILILVGSMLMFQTKVGLGTVLNVLLVGPMIAVLELLYDSIPTTWYTSLVVFLAGLFIMTFGRSLYISSRLGQGPRDGLFVGLARTSNFPVKYIKLLVEFTVFILGVIMLFWYPDVLAVSVGFGTVLIVLLSGYLIQWYFQWLGFHPTDTTEYDIVRYFKQKHLS